MLFACGTPAERAAEVALHEGEAPYRKGDFAGAAMIYASATTDGRVAANLGSALYRSGLLDTAIAGFAAATERSADIMVQARACYDLGNAWFMLSRRADSTANEAGRMLSTMTIQGQDIRQQVRRIVERDSIAREQVRLLSLVDSALAQSSNAYRNSLRRDPLDEDARHNLSLVDRIIAARRKDNADREGGKEDENNKALSARAMQLIEQADALVDEFKFAEALALLRNALAAEPSLSQRKDYMDKLDVVTKAAEAK